MAKDSSLICFIFKYTNTVQVTKMYELSICIGFFHTRGINGSLSIVLNRVIPSTKIVEHTIINNKTYFMYQIVKDISKASKYIEILFKAVCNFC